MHQVTRLARQSHEDPLTGIANRRHLDSELVRICHDAGGIEETVSVCMIDVDYFKAYNDRYGHLAGDMALRKIAAAMQSVARRTDCVARYGGEEFVLLLPGTTEPASVLDRLAATVADLAILHDASLTGHLTISCGCVVFTSCRDTSPAEILNASDKALYEAKMTGRNRSVIHLASD